MHREKGICMSSGTMNHRVRPIPLAVGVCAAFMFGVGCGPASSVDYSASVAQEFESHNRALPSMKRSEEPPQVFVDASLSMQGYVGRTTPNKPTEFEELLDALGYLLPGSEIYRFGQPAGQTSSAETMGGLITDGVLNDADYCTQIHQSKFYTREYNPDHLLI